MAIALLIAGDGHESLVRNPAIHKDLHENFIIVSMAFSQYGI
jgi:hypothetical protein